jgi:hypothetical protein
MANPARRLPATVEPVREPFAPSFYKTTIPPRAKPTLRQRFREAKDYAQLVKEFEAEAVAGDPEAQYVTAEASRWCGQTLKLYFIRPNGQIKTLDQVQERRATQSAGISQDELMQVYTRCHGFLEDPDLQRSMTLWSQWLDRSVAANFPAAMAEKARLMESDVLQASGGQLPSSQTAFGTEDEAMDLALRAVWSEDPDAIFMMRDWVRSGNRTEEENATIISAWQILACQKGYDCSPTSDLMKGLCDWDVQCADGQPYTQYFQRQLGTQYDDALRLAKAIENAIAAKDVQAIRSYL